LALSQRIQQQGKRWLGLITQTFLRLQNGGRIDISPRQG
jgi:hypothetical protein